MKTTLEKMAVMAEAVQGKKIGVTCYVNGVKVCNLVNDPPWNWGDYDYDVMVEPAECWVWIYANGERGGSFSSRKEAEEYRDTPGRAALMREVIE